MSKGINTESSLSAELQIGPTDTGMVRIFVSAGEIEIPMDFTPDEAREIAEELRAAAERTAPPAAQRKRTRRPKS